MPAVFVETLSTLSEKSDRKSFIRSLFKKSSSSTTTSSGAASLDEATPAAPTPKKAEEKTVKVRKTNNNAMVVHLSALSDDPSPMASDPWYCRACGAAVSSLSKLESVGETTSWKWYE